MVTATESMEGRSPCSEAFECGMFLKNVPMDRLVIMRTLAVVDEGMFAGDVRKHIGQYLCAQFHFASKLIL
jgi:hypothetical protein